MQPEAGGMRRFCPHCRTHVHDISAMDERQARAFLKATAKLSLCLAYTRDEDDRIVFADHSRAALPEPALPEPEPPSVVPVARLHRRPLPPPLTQLVCAASAAVLLGACTAHGDEPALEIDDPTLEIQVETVHPSVLIPAASELAPPPDPPAEPEPPQAEPCDPSARWRQTVKGRRVLDPDDPFD